MNELNVSIENIPGKLESFKKNDKFVANKTKYVYFVTVLSFSLD